SSATGRSFETLAGAAADFRAAGRRPGTRRMAAGRRAADEAAEHGGDVGAATDQVFAALLLQAMVRLKLATGPPPPISARIGDGRATALMAGMSSSLIEWA